MGTYHSQLFDFQIDWSVQEKRNSSALAMGLGLSYTNAGVPWNPT